MENTIESPHHCEPDAKPNLEDGAEKTETDSVSVVDLENIKLFVGQVPKSFVSPSQLKPLFDPYGEIIEVKIIFDKASNSHRGCAFVTFTKKEYAENAIEGLHGKLKLPGASHPMQVKFAKREEEKVNDHKLFIGMVSKSASEEDLRTLFLPYGEITEVSILRDPHSGDSRGCGFVLYTEKKSALQAIEALNQKYTMDGQNSALCVKFADNQKQREERKRMKQQLHQPRMPPMMHALQPLPPQSVNAYMMGNVYPSVYPTHPPAMPHSAAIGGQAPIAQSYSGHSTHHAAEDYSTNVTQPHYPSYTMPSAYPAGYGGVNYATVQAPQGQVGNAVSSGPPGSNLFIMHLPLEWTDNDLYSYFASYGNIVSAKVYIDKATGLSKCFGFVSYDNPQSAQYAIQYMDSFQVGGKRLRVSLKREGNAPY